MFTQHRKGNNQHEKVGVYFEKDGLGDAEVTGIIGQNLGPPFGRPKFGRFATQYRAANSQCHLKQVRHLGHSVGMSNTIASDDGCRSEPHVHALQTERTESVPLT